jgi:hypothetical protein
MSASSMPASRSTLGWMPLPTTPRRSSRSCSSRRRTGSVSMTVMSLRSDSRLSATLSPTRPAPRMRILAAVEGAGDGQVVDGEARWKGGGCSCSCADSHPQGPPGAARQQRAAAAAARRTAARPSASRSESLPAGAAALPQRRQRRRPARQRRVRRSAQCGGASPSRPLAAAAAEMRHRQIAQQRGAAAAASIASARQPTQPGRRRAHVDAARQPGRAQRAEHAAGEQAAAQRQAAGLAMSAFSPASAPLSMPPSSAAGPRRPCS